MKNLISAIFCMLIACLTLISCSDKKDSATLVKISFEPQKDYSLEIREILKNHKEGNLTLEFEKGIYHFYPEKAHGMYMCVSNNDNGYKRIAFFLEGMQNVRIKGSDTEFLFHGGIVPFYIDRCKNISLSGIDIDYDKSFIFEGKVIASNSTAMTFDIQPGDNTDYEIRGDRLFFSGYDWTVTPGQNIVFDPSTHAPYYYTSRYLHYDWKQELRAEDLGNRTIRISGFTGKDVPPAGSVYIDKGPYKQNRVYPGIVIHSSEDIHLTGMNIYMAGAMALIGENTKNVRMNGFNVRLRENSGRYISASADATHFVNCRGVLSFENCLFENMLDDATNVHGTYMPVDEVLSGNSFSVRFGHWQQQGFRFASPGDTLQIIDRHSLMPIQKFIVKNTEAVNNFYWVIDSETDLEPLSHAKDLAVENLSNTASVVIRNCTVRNNRARSILISTPKPVLIENNYFDSMMAGLLIAGDANSWFESGNVSDVVIRNNTFVNMGKGGEAPQSVLQISPEIPPQFRDKGYYHGKIVFENNTVKTFDSQVIYALSVSDLIIRNNTFIQSKDYLPIFDGLSYIDIQNCGNVQVTGNSYEGDEKAEISGLDCDEIELDNNKGFHPSVVEKPNKYFYQQ